MNKYILGFSLLCLAACGQHAGSTAGGDDASSKDAAKDSASGIDARTPVTAVTIGHDALNDSIELNAVSAFLQKSYVKANTNGYLQTTDVYLGKYVQVGQPLFSLKTKEAQTIGNSLKILDSTLSFSGVNQIKANQHGYVTQLDHQAGDYVQDGEQLAIISDQNSFVFLLNLPYELRPYVLDKHTVELYLPDGEKLTGMIGSVMPSVDSASQTQSVVIRVNPPHAIPENLIAKVRILKMAHGNTQSVPRTAVLTNDTESDFWVMKLIDSATAVKIPIKKGFETKDRVEVLSPQFSQPTKYWLPVITGYRILRK